jgi:hypothetical protein
MRFTEPEIEALDLTCPDDLIWLILEFFCTKPLEKAASSADRALVALLLKRAADQGLNYEQFNELLLVLRQNRVSRAFFKFFFGDGTVSLAGLRAGVIRFRGLAMLCYGNFIYARRTLTRLGTEAEIRESMRRFGKPTADLLSEFQTRPDPIVDIEPIKRCNTWLNGEITGKIIEKEAKILSGRLAEAELSTTDPETMAFAKHLVELDELNKNVQINAQSNTNVYLTWDYLDVYVATSMRNNCEFEEVYDFIQDVFLHKPIQSLKLRYFDPTQSKCANARDKGLLEGLMLKRAACTIYMAQEGDTLGKDSELAATLAQGKPVIVYVPKYETATLAHKVRSYPLDFLKRRLLVLDADGVLDDPECERRLAASIPEYEATINEFLRQFAEHRRTQPFTLGLVWDEQFKSSFREFDDLCQVLAIAETFNFDRRACLLQGRHPLAMQVDLNTGIANGVLVVRTAEKCAKLLYGLLTNELELEIGPDLENNHFTVLREVLSQSPFRVVTHNERLTNSFWNVFGDRC